MYFGLFPAENSYNFRIKTNSHGANSQNGIWIFLVQNQLIEPSAWVMLHNLCSVSNNFTRGPILAVPQYLICYYRQMFIPMVWNILLWKSDPFQIDNLKLFMLQLVYVAKLFTRFWDIGYVLLISEHFWVGWTSIQCISG